MRTIRVFLFVSAFATAAAAVPLDIVNVSAPAINCKFDTDCKVTVSDTSAPIAGLPGSRGGGFLQSRTFPPGQAGTAAAGLFAYLYRIDLRELVGVTAAPCVSRLRLAFGPVSLVDYNGDGNTDQVFVITTGGLGSVAPSAADQAGHQITFTFNPPVCSGSSPGRGETSFFFGLASTRPDRHVTAQITYSPGAGTLSLDARVPQLAAGGFVIVPPGRIRAGRTIPVRVTGAGPGASLDLYTGTGSGSTRAQSCAGLSVSIERARLAVSAVADAKGNAALKLFVPANLRGKTFLLQAVDRSICVASEPVNVKPN
jgi:hypothetical protein